LIKTLLQQKRPNFKQVIYMFESAKKLRLRAFLAISLLISIVTLGSFAAYAFQSISIPLEVKEPIEIIDYPSGFSLYSGETVTFEITIQNLASVTHFVELDFRLNDTEYQAKYVTFSNTNYSVPSGTQKLAAWLTVAPKAPPANLMITVNRKTDTPSPSPTPSPPNDYNTSLVPSLQLLGGGARWAAKEGKTALYVNWNDNWAAHHLTDGADWEWISESSREVWTSSVVVALEHADFEVTLAGDIPANLMDYDLVVIFAYYAVEPRHEPLIRDYVFNGGSLVLLSGTPCFLTEYSKVLGTGTDLTSIQDWFGCSTYLNTEGTVHPAFDNPFGTSFSTKDVLLTKEILWHAGVTSLNEGSQPIAFWNSGAVFAFTHEYGDGRVYYQAKVK
jgi:hypothetical protein